MLNLWNLINLYTYTWMVVFQIWRPCQFGYSVKWSFWSEHLAFQPYRFHVFQVPLTQFLKMLLDLLNILLWVKQKVARYGLKQSEIYKSLLEIEDVLMLNISGLRLGLVHGSHFSALTKILTFPVFFPYFSRIFTARNEVGARLCFYRRLWFCPQGRVPDQVHPPRTRYTPQDQVHPLQDQVHPLGPGTPPMGPGAPPQTRYPPRPGTPPRTRYTPPGPGTPPLGPGTPPGPRYTSPWPGTPPRTRYTPWDQVHTRTRYTPQDQVHPSGPGTPPSTEHAGRYSQCVGSMHPTGMQSCF